MKTRLYLDTRQPTSSGGDEYRLMYGISKNGRTAYINMGISLKIEQWDSKHRCIVELPPKRWANREIVRNAISRKSAAITSQLMELELKGALHNLTAMEIRDYLNADAESSRPEARLLDVIREYGNKHDTPRTREIYEATARKIERTMPKASTLTLEDVSVKWLNDFDFEMRRSVPSVNGRAVHMRNLRAAIKYAFDAGLTNNYPFRKFRIRSMETIKRDLTLNQLRQYLEADIPPALQEYRDIFELMIYLCGINFTDLLNLKRSNIRNGRIEYKRAKTHKFYSIKLEPEALYIINRWAGRDWLLDVRDRYKNPHEYLKRLNPGLREVIKEPPYSSITTYWARHTMATLMINELNEPVEVVSAALGHEYGSKITAVYVDFDRKKVDIANRKLIDKIWENGRKPC